MIARSGKTFSFSEGIIFEDACKNVNRRSSNDVESERHETI